MFYYFRPDGVFVHKRADGSFPVIERHNHERHIKWSEVLLPVELRGPPRSTLKAQTKWQKTSILESCQAMTDDQLQDEPKKPCKMNARELVASYALEVLSSNPLKRSTMGMVVSGDRLEVWHFDRLGCLGSETITLNRETHFQHFVKMIVYIVKSSAETLGFEPSFEYDGASSWPHSLDICTLRIPPSAGEKGASVIATIASDEPLHRSRCLSGRGTSILPVKLEKKDDEISVLKIGWQVSSRMSEAEFYELGAGVEGLPEIKCSGTIVPSLREGVRGRLEQVLPWKPDRILPVDLSFRVLVMRERYYPLTESIGSKSLLSDPKMLLEVMKSLLSGSSSEFMVYNLLIGLTCQHNSASITF